MLRVLENMVNRMAVGEMEIFTEFYEVKITGLTFYVQGDFSKHLDVHMKDQIHPINEDARIQNINQLELTLYVSGL